MSLERAFSFGAPRHRSTLACASTKTLQCVHGHTQPPPCSSQYLKQHAQTSAYQHTLRIPSRPIQPISPRCAAPGAAARARRARS
eukprot:4839548-Pleurochrysis_carterae.AAC.1